MMNFLIISDLNNEVLLNKNLFFPLMAQNKAKVAEI